MDIAQDSDLTDNSLATQRSISKEVTNLNVTKTVLWVRAGVIIKIFLPLLRRIVLVAIDVTVVH